MLYLTELFKSFNLTKQKAYIFVGVMFLLLIVENVFGVNIPLFYVSDENTMPFVLALAAVLGFGLKNSADTAAALKEANDNAIAAVALAMNVSKETLEKLIEDVKAFQAATEEKGKTP